jgi:hypothetical protein
MGKVARKNSWNGWLESFELGERRYEETGLEQYPNDMRTMNAPISRRPATLKKRKFKTELFTAVSAATSGDIRYLICVERIK